MRLLLDTNVLIRMLEEPERLNIPVQDALDDTGNTLFVTTVALVEIAIKVATGKLSMPREIMNRLKALGCDWLPVLPAHALRMAGLKVLHKDPFDRLIVSQALAEDLILVTTDRQLAEYGVVILKA